MNTIEKLRAETTPVPGKPGQRVDGQGRVWYSSFFLGAPERDGAAIIGFDVRGECVSVPTIPTAAAIRATIERGAHDA